jgi:hypothetical protein
MTTIAGEKFLKPFIERVVVYAVDEAALSQEAEILIFWDGVIPLILAGDPSQLPAVIIS